MKTDWVRGLPITTMFVLELLRNKIEEAQEAASLDEVQAALSEAALDIDHLARVAHEAARQIREEAE